MYLAVPGALIYLLYLRGQHPRCPGPGGHHAHRTNQHQIPAIRSSGSNGLYVCQELIAQGFAVSYKSASNVTADITLLQHGIPQLALATNGSVDLANTVIKVRNSWSTQFGLNGDYLLHASTLNYLLKYYDFKAVVLA